MRMHGIQEVSAQMISDCLWFSIFTTSTPCGHASYMDRASFPKAGYAPLLWPARSRSVWALQSPWYYTNITCHSTILHLLPCRGSFQLIQLPPHNKMWPLKPPKHRVQRVHREGERIHISRRGWTYFSFCLKGCHFAESRTERLCTCWQLNRIIWEYGIFLCRVPVCHLTTVPS